MPDLVITDWQMPELDGSGIIRKIREQDPARAIVVMSARSDASTVDDRLGACTAGYVAKPIDRDEPLRVVERAIARSPPMLPI